MNVRHVFGVACCLALGIAIGQISPLSGQQAAAQLAATGRYQMTATTHPSTVVFVCDTTTGRVWLNRTVVTDEWVTLGSPIEKAKAK